MSFAEDSGSSARRYTLPEGSSVRSVEHSTYTKKEYGEKTWTTGQSLRDILQNHLDANTQLYVDYLVEAILDVAAFEKRVNSLKDPADIRKLDDFVNLLYRYKKGFHDRSPEAQEELRLHIQTFTQTLPLKSQFLSEGQVINWAAVDSVTWRITEKPPQIVYEVVDSLQEEVPRWVSLQDFKTEKYQEMLTTDREGIKVDNGFRFKIRGMRIQDQGKGYDSKLTAFYKSTKTGKKYLRGKFGEGAKMSEAHLLRHGAKLKARSVFETKQGGVSRLRAWQLRPLLGKDDVIYMKGLEAEMPGIDTATGSCTVIRLQEADPAFQADFQAHADPRLSEGLEANTVEFSHTFFAYPQGGKLSSSELPMGVNVTEGRRVYVQGLRIPLEEMWRGVSTVPAFSYNILDSSIIGGRDRNTVTSEAFSAIKAFWMNLDSPHLIQMWAFNWMRTEKNTIEAEALNELIESSGNELSEKKQKTHDLLMQGLPKILGLREGRKYVLVSQTERYEAQRPEAARLQQSLKELGYELIEVRSASPATLSVLAEKLKTEFDVRSLEQVQLEFKSMAEEVESLETPEELKQIFQRSYDRCVQRVSAAGLDVGDFRLLPEVVTTKTFNDDDEPIELAYSSGSKQFQIKLRPEQMGASTPQNLDYWTERLEPYILATYLRDEPFVSKKDVLQAAQDVSQELLNEVTDATPKFDQLNFNFDHTLSVQTTEELADSYFNRLNEFAAHFEGWLKLATSRNISTTPEELKRVWEISETFPPYYRTQAKEILKQRVILQNNRVAFFHEGKFIESDVSGLTVITEFNGQPVYELPDKRIIYPVSINEGTMVIPTPSGKDYFIRYGDKMYHSNEHAFRVSSFSHPLNVEGNCLVIARSYGGSFTPDEAQQKLFELEIKEAEKPGSRNIINKTDVIKTALPIEYGETEWNNPVRVFQDIIQNHLDGSLGKPVELRFKVQAFDGSSRWILRNELKYNDEIVGFQIVDHGSGYTPNEIGLMGNSSKRTPLFAGKYGEGQKMIAAAAARNGFKLSFSSVGLYEDKPHRWQAEVGTEDEEIMIDGSPEVVKRVVFNSSAEKESERNFTSSTTLELPSNATSQQWYEWRKWVDIINPSHKDDKGNEGLARYVLQLRPLSDRVIDLGFMRILLDEPGAIYENGLLINNLRPSNSIVGYDVPDIVTTRERNRFSHDKLEKYIGLALTECTDIRYLEALFQVLRDTYLDAMKKTGKLVVDKETELFFPGISYNTFNMARPLWDAMNEEFLGGIFIHNAEKVNSTIEYLESKKSPNEDDKIRLEKYRRVAANIKHLPSDRVVEVSKYSLDYFANLFPLAEEYVESLDVSAIEVSQETHEQLIEITASAAEMIFAMLQQEKMVGTEVVNPLMAAVMREYKTVDYLRYLDPETKLDNLEYYTQEVNKKIKPWMDRDFLRAHKEMIFVSPQHAGYLGIAEKDRIGFNEQLLTPERKRKVIATAIHELIHKIFGLTDYTPEFTLIMNKITDEILRNNPAA